MKDIKGELEEKIYNAIHCLTDDDGYDFPDTNLVKRANAHLNEALKIIRTKLSTSDMDLEAEAISLYKSEFEVTESIIYQYDEEREAHFKDTIRFATKFARTILSRNENINPPKTDEQ